MDIISSFTLLDGILVVILLFFVASGFRFGFIMALGALVGTVIGALVAGLYFEQGADILNGFIKNENLARVVAFIVIFVLVSRLVGLVFWVVDKIFKVISIIPFLKSINRLAGAIFGFLEGVVIVSVALLFIDKFPFAEYVIPAVDNSVAAQWLLGYGQYLTPLLPEAVKLLESHFTLPF